MSASVDLIGHRFGRLTVTKRVGQSKNAHILWECMCDCGTLTVVSSDKLRNGHTQSCGCFKRDQSSAAHSTHRMSSTRLYNVWAGMLKRCRSSTDRLYGGRGISVCDEWTDFAAFYEWAINSGYSDALSLDRIDVDGDYCPKNCRWATAKMQQNNKRNNKRITFNNETHTIAEWAELKKLPINTLWSRLYRLHWEVDRALSTPSKIIEVRNDEKSA